MNWQKNRQSLSVISFIARLNYLPEWFIYNYQDKIIFTIGNVSKINSHGQTIYNMLKKLNDQLSLMKKIFCQRKCLFLKKINTHFKIKTFHKQISKAYGVCFDSNNGLLKITFSYFVSFVLVF